MAFLDGFPFYSIFASHSFNLWIQLSCVKIQITYQMHFRFQMGCKLDFMLHTNQERSRLIFLLNHAQDLLFQIAWSPFSKCSPSSVSFLRILNSLSMLSFCSLLRSKSQTIHVPIFTTTLTIIFWHIVGFCLATKYRVWSIRLWGWASFSSS